MKFKIEKDNELDNYSVRVCLPFEGWVWLGEVATYSLAQSLVKIYNEKSKKKTKSTVTPNTGITLKNKKGEKIDRVVRF
jgi:uncharacterized membrane protein YfbV (UPF0208 family)